MPEPLRVAVIGLGEVAVRRHLPVLQASPLFHLTAAAETDAVRADRVANEFGIATVSAEARAVIEADDVDVVAILTPPATHAEFAHMALEAGKHVFIEKPLSLDVAEAEDLTAHAERVTTKVLVGFNQRHHIQVQQGRAMLRGGQLGAIRTAASFLGNTYHRTRMSAWHSDFKHGGDLLFELGVHHFDALRYLLDADVTEVYAQEATTAQGSATFTTQLRMSSGALVTTTLGEETLEHNLFEIVGEGGKLTLALYRYDGLEVLPRTVPEGNFGLRFGRIGSMFTQLPAALPRIRRGGDYVLTYRAEWEHLYHIIQTNAPPLASARDGLEATRIAHAARSSLTRHAPVTLAR